MGSTTGARRHYASRLVSHLAKTDALDAKVIALFAERVRPQPRRLPEPERSHLNELVGRRRQIIEMIGMETNRRGQAVDKQLARRLNRHTDGRSCLLHSANAAH